MKQSKAFHKGIRRVWSRLSAGSGTSRLDFQVDQGQTNLRKWSTCLRHCWMTDFNLQLHLNFFVTNINNNLTSEPSIGDKH